MLTTFVTRERAAWAGIISVFLTVLTITLSVMLFDGFDWGRHALSTLAHFDKESADQSRYVFSGGLLLTAVLGLVFSVGLSRLEERRLWQAGSVLYALSHLAIVWIVVFPAGVPQHRWVSVFPFFTGALVFLGVDQLRIPETRLFGVVVLSNLLVASLGAFLVLQTDIEGWVIHQLLGVAVFAIATLLFAARMLGTIGIQDVE